MHDNPIDGRLRAMASLILRADREDEEWAGELIRSTRKLPRARRMELQEIINRSEDNDRAG